MCRVIVPLPADYSGWKPNRINAGQGDGHRGNKFLAPVRGPLLRPSGLPWYRMSMARKVTPDQFELPGLGSPALIRSKAAYVKSQQQTRKHHCHWPGCEVQVPPALWGCKPHWFRLPGDLRRRIWAAYRPGQERDMSPSEDYLKVAHEVQEWIRLHGGPV